MIDLIVDLGEHFEVLLLPDACVETREGGLCSLESRRNRTTILLSDGSRRND